MAEKQWPLALTEAPLEVFTDTSAYGLLDVINGCTPGPSSSFMPVSLTLQCGFIALPIRRRLHLPTPTGWPVICFGQEESGKDIVPVWSFGPQETLQLPLDLSEPFNSCYMSKLWTNLPEDPEEKEVPDILAYQKPPLQCVTDLHLDQQTSPLTLTGPGCMSKLTQDQQNDLANP